MITVSICMIVKNEEEFLARCLDSVRDFAEEIIIVDTGSTDKTKVIAAKYTDKIYDFTWTGDFAAARNFAFSKATMDYIYSVDADEVVDEENRQRFLQLKKNLLPEIDIVQMKYGNQLEYGTIYNFDEEYRPKLFKRIRTFTWIEPIHETIQVNPIVYDSDIIIGHYPKENHAKRDFAAFERIADSEEYMSSRLHNLYAKELFVSGRNEDFVKAGPFFGMSTKDINRSSEEIMEACCVAAKAAAINGKITDFFTYALKVIAQGGCSEMCCELGHFYENRGDFEEAIVWYFNAAFETEAILALKWKDDYPLQGLVRCYYALGLYEQAQEYMNELEKRS